MEYGEAMEYLTGFYGIGKKVANCICLFGLHQIGAFPIDTWIEKILMEHYYDKRNTAVSPKPIFSTESWKTALGHTAAMPVLCSNIFSTMNVCCKTKSASFKRWFRRQHSPSDQI